MAEAGEAVYCTLLMSDIYLPGAMVLAHSLRDNRTRGKIVALVTLDTLHESTVNELKTVYDDVIPVGRFTNNTPANLFLMDRPDLIAAFTKIELWRQTQYSKIVYLDADVVSLRAPDELLTLDKDFAAVPDIGWPDCFNTGVMVLKPNLRDYYSLLALAQRGISFDGADQGLLNMHFRDWHRLSFTYNCTPSGNYQYLPAYRHFGSTISMVHYIGKQKPWSMERQATLFGGPYRELLGKWWEVYDRHYSPKMGTGAKDDIKSYSYAKNTTQKHYYPVEESSRSLSPAALQVSGQDLRQKLTGSAESQKVDETYSLETPAAVESISQHDDGALEKESTNVWASVVPRYVRGEQHIAAHQHHHVDLPQPSRSYDKPIDQSKAPAQRTPLPAISEQPRNIEMAPEPHITETPNLESTIQEQRPMSSVEVEWDASRAPPPINTKPEAIGLPTQTYSMSRDTKLFKPPKSYPEAPKNMYYEVPPVQPVPKKPPPIFPWEEYAPKPTRVFLDESRETDPRVGEPASLPTASSSDPATAEEERYLTPTKRSPSVDPWKSYTLSNAWDEVPEIERYVEAINRSRKPKTQVLSGNKTRTPDPSVQEDSAARKPSMKITDFPTELERPSLPVTPAAIRRTSFWGEEQEESAELPTAEGVPEQEDWNPVASLQELQRRQTEFFENNSWVNPRGGT